MPSFCVGHGIDVHEFTTLKQGVFLGGVFIPFDQGLEGHSDADVVLHALVDAILGAICEGDIGQHFPPSDSQWKGADSTVFVRYALDLMYRAKGTLCHVDITVMGEAPKIYPHREVMRQKIAVLTGLSLKRVNIKATTTEKLGFLGRGEGLAAFATATVSFSDDDLDCDENTPFLSHALQEGG